MYIYIYIYIVYDNNTIMGVCYGVLNLLPYLFLFVIEL